MMANYFESLAQTFLVGENLLYHAAAWTKYYQIAQLNKNLSVKEQEALASQVLISALSAPPSRSASSSAEALSPKAAAAQARLNQLLRMDKSPSREELLKEAVCDMTCLLCTWSQNTNAMKKQLGKNVLPKVRPEFKELYDLLEVQFQPLLLCQKAGPLIAALSKDPVFAKYVKPIHQVILTRVLQQVILKCNTPASSNSLM